MSAAARMIGGPAAAAEAAVAAVAAAAPAIGPNGAPQRRVPAYGDAAARAEAARLKAEVAVFLALPLNPFGSYPMWEDEMLLSLADGYLADEGIPDYQLFGNETHELFRRLARHRGSRRTAVGYLKRYRLLKAREEGKPTPEKRRVLPFVVIPWGDRPLPEPLTPAEYARLPKFKSKEPYTPAESGLLLALIERHRSEGSIKKLVYGDDAVVPRAMGRYLGFRRGPTAYDAQYKRMRRSGTAVATVSGVPADLREGLLPEPMPWSDVQGMPLVSAERPFTPEEDALLLRAVSRYAPNRLSVYDALAPCDSSARCAIATALQFRRSNVSYLERYRELKGGAPAPAEAERPARLLTEAQVQAHVEARALERARAQAAAQMRERERARVESQIRAKARAQARAQAQAHAQAQTRVQAQVRARAAKAQAQARPPPPQQPPPAKRVRANAPDESEEAAAMAALASLGGGGPSAAASEAAPAKEGKAEMAARRKEADAPLLAAGSLAKQAMRADSKAADKYEAVDAALRKAMADGARDQALAALEAGGADSDDRDSFAVIVDEEREWLEMRADEEFEWHRRRVEEQCSWFAERRRKLARSGPLNAEELATARLEIARAQAAAMWEASRLRRERAKSEGAELRRLLADALRGDEPGG